jgi:acyl-coenzyme A thioesterase 13
MVDVPTNFTQSIRSSPYLDLIGPIYETGEGANYKLGLRIDHRHLNMRGQCHGAIFAAIADVFLGRLVVMSKGKSLPLVTVSLGLDYLSAALPGAWLEASGKVDRVGRSLAHSSGIISADGKPALRCSAIFQVIAGEVPGRGAEKS